MSNTDPYATTPTTPDDWVDHVGPHLMILVPDKALTRHPLAHIMIPLESRGH